MPLILRGATSQTGNLLEFQRNDGFVWLSFSSAGRPIFQDAIIDIRYGGSTTGGWHPTQGGWMAMPGYGYNFTNDSSFNTIDAAFKRSSAGIVELNNGSTGGASFQFIEQTAPSSPASNKTVLYAEDNGSGKTRLMVKFATGAAQQVAIEP